MSVAVQGSMTASLGDRLQSRVTSHYDERYYEGHLKPRSRAVVVQRLHAIGEHVHGAASVLDYGCSDGNLLAAIESPRRAGVEINPHSRAIATDAGFDVRPDLESFGEERFDRIVSCHVLEHVTSPADTLGQLARRLSQDGRLVLNLPMNDCRDRRHRRWEPGDVNQHLHAWTPLTLGNLLSVAGFEPLDVRVHPYVYPSRPAWLIRLSESAPQLWRGVGRAYGLFLKRHQLVAVARLRR